MSQGVDESLKAYYEKTGDSYDEAHLNEVEHVVALATLSGYTQFYNVKSLLDVGAGTGRVIRHFKEKGLQTEVRGIEPSAKLRSIAEQNGVEIGEIVDGDALSLPFENDSFDVVCSFGVLHHIKDANAAIQEMCRVAKNGVFVSDLNNLGCGSLAQRVIANTLYSLKLWRLFQFLKNGFKTEKYSEGDGIHYSFSYLDVMKNVRKKFPQVYFQNTKGKSHHLRFSASHVCFFATKVPLDSEKSLM